jgi:hypothetical protein
MSAAQVPGTPAAAPIAVPAADQPPAESQPKSFADRWKAHGGEDLDAGDDEPEAAPEPAKPETKPTGPVTAGDKAMFEALAKKLGIKVENGVVKPSERIAWENAKLRAEQGIAKARHEAEQMRAEAESSLKSNPRVQKAEAIMTAYEAGDPDGFAAALGAKDFNEFQQSFLRRLADPNYGELRKLQQWKEQQEAERVKLEAQQREQHQQQQVQQAERTYMSTLSQTCKASSNPLVAAMHDDPLFLQAVYRIQKKHWNPEQQKTVSVEEAIQEGLETELKSLHDRLSRGFGGGSPAAEPGAAPVRNGKKPAPRTGITPVNAALGGGATKKPSDMTDLEWRTYTRKRMDEAGD